MKLLDLLLVADGVVVVILLVGCLRIIAVADIENVVGHVFHGDEPRSATESQSFELSDSVGPQSTVLADVLSRLPFDDVTGLLLSDNVELLKIRMQKNWNDVDDAYKQLVLTKKSIEQSEENLRLNRNYYQAGTVTMSDLLDVQQQYQQCCDRYTDAYAALQTKIVAYEQSVGR